MSEFSRLHAIGFACELTRTDAEFIARIAKDESNRIACRSGEYRRWESPRGTQIWLHYPRPAGSPQPDNDQQPFDPISDLKGLSTFHCGASAVELLLSHSVAASASNRLDGVCHAHLPAMPGRGRTVPFVFEQIGFGIDPVETPVRALVQISGLAHKVWAYDSERSYLALTPKQRLVGRGAMLPVEPDEVKDVKLLYRGHPETLWLVTGQLRRAARMVNAEAGTSYHWMLLETDRGDIDVIANPDVIVGEVAAGQTVAAVVSMAGRIVERLGPS